MTRSLTLLIIGILFWGISSLVVPSLGIHMVARVGVLMITMLAVWGMFLWGYVEARKEQADKRKPKSSD